MSLELIYDAPVGTRFKRCYFRDIHPGFGETYQESLWWLYHERKWVGPDDARRPASTHAPCRSVKAFIRHVEKHRHQLAGRRVTLLSRYVGHDVHIDVPALEAA